MLDEKMIQKNGTNTENTQIGTINNFGLNYSDTKALCQDLISDELRIYKDKAEKVARERNEIFENNFFERLEKENLANTTVLEEFKNPDMQYSYVNAQKAFIRTGTKEMEGILAQLLVDRVKENDRSLLQIALNESITVISVLLPEQLDILALVFLLKYTSNLTIVNFDTFQKYCLQKILPFVKNIGKKNSSYQHIEYSKCGNIGLLENSLADNFAREYKGLFLKGFKQEDQKKYLDQYPNLFTKCLNDNSLMQVNAMAEDIIESKFKKMEAPLEDENEIKKLFNSNVMNNDEIKTKIVGLVPEMGNLFDVWDNSYLKNLTLTSVGIVIGATQVKKISSKDFDLKIWI